MTLPIVTVVGAVLEDERGRILLAQRPADKSMPFFWELPGGKLEAGESPEEALVRELYEEVGLIASPHNLKPLTFVSMTYPDFHIILLCYECLEWTGTPSAREGQGGIEWVRPQDFPQYSMREANTALMPLLLSRVRNKEQVETSSVPFPEISVRS